MLHPNSKVWFHFFRWINLCLPSADWSWHGLPWLEGGFSVFCTQFVSTGHLWAGKRWCCPDCHRPWFRRWPTRAILPESHWNIWWVVPLQGDDRGKLRSQQQHQANCSQWVKDTKSWQLYWTKSSPNLTFSKSSIISELLAPASNTRVTSDPSPPVAYEGSHFVLSCNVAKGSHLSYTWFFNKDKVRSSTSSFLLTGNKLVMGKVTPKHAGYYSCMAWSRVQDTTRFSASTEVQMVVKGMCQQKIQEVFRLYASFCPY